MKNKVCSSPADGSKLKQPNSENSTSIRGPNRPILTRWIKIVLASLLLLFVAYTLAKVGQILTLPDDSKSDNALKNLGNSTEFEPQQDNSTYDLNNELYTSTELRNPPSRTTRVTYAQNTTKSHTSQPAEATPAVTGGTKR